MGVNNPRDKQFEGFAKLLFEDLYWTGEVWFECADNEWKEEWREVIARRAYDLASHVVESVTDQESNCQYDSQHIHMGMLESVPDLTKWPDGDKEE